MRPLPSLLPLLVLLGACASAPRAPEPAPTAVREVSVQRIALAGPLARRDAEVSGMAWAGDVLVLLPERPGMYATPGTDGAFFGLSRQDILDVLDGKASGPLEPRPIPLYAPGLAELERTDGLEGFEAIAFSGDTVFVNLECEPSTGAFGQLVRGRVEPGVTAIHLDLSVRRRLPSQSHLENMTDEALVVAGDRVLTFHEVNGAAHNPSPVAHVFGADLEPRGTLPFPRLEYRITDATPPDAEGRFWAINYFFPKDRELGVEEEPLAARFGRGPSHARSKIVERLVELRVTETGVERVDVPPIQLELREDGEARKWEAIAPLAGRGFLLATDMFPETILGFAPVR